MLLPPWCAARRALRGSAAALAPACPELLGHPADVRGIGLRPRSRRASTLRQLLSQIDDRVVLERLGIENAGGHLVDDPLGEQVTCGLRIIRLREVAVAGLQRLPCAIEGGND